MGAVTMYILFDVSKLNFIDAQNNTFGATVWSPSAGKISITWASSTYPGGNNINGLFLNLRFTYLGGGGTPITFNDGCELADISAVIVPVNWNNGGMNFTSFQLSGIVTYDGSFGPLAGVTVYVKDGPEPVPPATLPIPNILYSTVTDGTGYFQFTVPSGTYYLYASNPAAWAGVDLADVTNIKRYIAGLIPNSIGTDALRIRAADITQDGIVDLSDVTPLKRRIGGLLPNPNYLAPDWMFENPSVTISSANVIQNFMGIVSGDVNGSYPF
jgi:hypothetical protein